MLNVMGGRLVPMSLHATNRYFIPNWGRGGVTYRYLSWFLNAHNKTPKVVFFF